MSKEFALYKGDDLLAIGTEEEISATMGIKVESVKFYGSPSYKRRTSDEKGRRLVALDV